VIDDIILLKIEKSGDSAIPSSGKGRKGFGEHYQLILGVETPPCHHTIQRTPSVGREFNEEIIFFINQT
jgi:hypothetical protein